MRQGKGNLLPPLCETGEGSDSVPDPERHTVVWLLVLPGTRFRLSPGIPAHSSGGRDVTRQTAVGLYYVYDVMYEETWGKAHFFRGHVELQPF
jgi:hypothetical protein